MKDEQVRCCDQWYQRRQTDLEDKQEFAISYGPYVISGNMSEVGVSRIGWVTERKFQTEGGVAYQPLLVSE